MSHADDLRIEALKKAQMANAFSGLPWMFHPRIADKYDSSFRSLVALNIAETLGRFPSEDKNPAVNHGSAAIVGRVILRRDAGKKLMFLTVQDRSGKMQVALNAVDFGDQMMEHFRKTIAIWDIMGFEGRLGFSNTGEPTLWTMNAQFMGKSLRPAPDKMEGVCKKETRYRQRYLELIGS